MAAAVFIVATLAGALDFYAGQIPPVYHEVVAHFKLEAVCKQHSSRPTRSTGGHDDFLVGGKLVKPVHERRVQIAAGFEAHFNAALLLPPMDGDPIANLRDDVKCAARFTLANRVNARELRALSALKHRSYAKMLRSCSNNVNRAEMPPHVYYIAGATNTCLMAAWIDGFSLRDVAFVQEFCHGFIVVPPPGEFIPDSLSFKAVPPSVKSKRARKRAWHAFQDSSYDWAMHVYHATAISVVEL